MKNLLSQKIVLYIGILLMIIGGAGLLNTNADKQKTEKDQPVAVKQTAAQITSNANGTIVSYEGIEGETALDLLKSGAEVITQESSFGEFVSAINGVEQTDTEFWLYYVNDEAASVGAGEYITKGGDKVEWRLEN